MHRFDAEKATGSEREIKRALNELEDRVSALEGEAGIEPTGAVKELEDRVSALEGETGIEPTGTPEPDTQEEPEETAPEGEVPLDFPHRKILERRGLLLVEDLEEYSVEELIELEEIGEARASDIVEARRAL